ncbi:MAG: YqgE/AlgH family protein [Pseudobdellovibrionaceae bacterium]
MKEISIWIRAIFNWQMMLAAFFILTPTFLNNYTGITGKIFAAAPTTGGQFQHAALYMFNHKWYEAQAFVINRPLDAATYPRLPESLKDAPVKLPLYWGGPVRDNETVFVLSIQEDDSVKMAPLATWQKDTPDILEVIAKSPENYRIYIGYAGWGVLQYNFEDMRHAWEVSDLKQNFLRRSDLTPEEMWKRVIGSSEEKRKPQSPLVM